jgi:lipoprotein-anchoring transpeptidase ErfK/SrfK
MCRQTRNWAGFLLFVSLPTLVAAQAVADPADVAKPEEKKPENAAIAPLPPVVEPKPIPVTTPVKPTAPKKKPFSDGLKPGQFVWEKRANDVKDLRIVAVLDIQRIYVFDGSTLVAFSTMSSGKKGHATPTGAFKILQKNVDHKSNIYNNAPMPYMQRLTWDGIALHAGHIPGYPASHGCLRLPMAFAKSLYGITKMDQVVTVLPDLNAPRPKPEDVKPEVKPDTGVKPNVKPEGGAAVDEPKPIPGA